jgi:DNA-binding PadR family transcriptional regulator
MLRGIWLNKRANEKSFEVHFWSVSLTFAIINSTIDNSKSGGVVMLSIDLVILGIVLEKPQSAYDIQKDVEYHHFSRWTKISVPSIYRKVLQLSEKGYLQSDIVKGDKFADKAIYSITDQGRAYFKELMASCAAGPVPLLFDFNVVITNLNKMDKAEALELVSTLRWSIQSSVEANEGYAREFADIPLVGRTIFEQQQLLYRALMEWLNHFEGRFLQE